MTVSPRVAGFALVLILALLAATGCASLQPGGNASSSSVFGTLQDITLADVQAAHDDAHAHGDVVAETCWAFWLGAIRSGLPSAPSLKGAASALQLARDLRGAGGQPSALTSFRAQHDLSCAALEKQEGREILKLGATFGAPGLGGLGGMLLR